MTVKLRCEKFEYYLWVKEFEDVVVTLGVERVYLYLEQFLSKIYKRTIQVVFELFWSYNTRHNKQIEIWNMSVVS